MEHVGELKDTQIPALWNELERHQFLISRLSTGWHIFRFLILPDSNLIQAK